MFALARFAVLIAQLYVGFSIASLGAVMVFMGLLNGPAALLMVPAGAGVIWAAYRVVAAMERVRERLSDV